jgi:hypothetical protein
VSTQICTPAADLWGSRFRLLEFDFANRLLGDCPYDALVLRELFYAIDPDLEVNRLEETRDEVVGKGFADEADLTPLRSPSTAGDLEEDL